jgi:hypothetical protein
MSSSFSHKDSNSFVLLNSRAIQFADESGESDVMLPLEPAPTTKTINDWIALHTLPLVVDFSQVCCLGLLFGDCTTLTCANRTHKAQT